MDTHNLNVDPMVLAAYAMKAFNQTHGLAYAQISQDLTIRQASPNFAQFVDLYQLPAGNLLTDILPTFVGLEKTLQDILDGISPSYLLEYVAYDLLDGTVGYLNIQVTPIDDDNPGYGLLLLIEDVSRVGRLQQTIVQERNELSLTQYRLEKAHKRQQQLNRQKSLFMSIIAHDLRGPLSGIQGYAALTKAYTKDERLLRYSTNIISQINLLNDMIGDLHDLDRIEENKIALEIGLDNINDIVLEVTKAVATDIEKKKQTLHVDIPTESLEIQADTSRIWRIVYNLLNNAIKYTLKGGVIDLHVSKASDDTILIKVTDNGIGMTEDEVDHLFDLYYRADNVQQTGATGSGLGLYIVKGLVEAHNGRIEVVSKPQKGSTFSAYLPILA